MAKATRKYKEYSQEEKQQYREQKKEQEKLDFELVQSLLIKRLEDVIAMGDDYATRWVKSWQTSEPQNISGWKYNGYNREYFRLLGINYTITPKQLLYRNRKEFGKDESKYYKPNADAILYPVFKYGYKEFIYTEKDEDTGEEEKKVGARCWYKGYQVYDVKDIKGFPCPKPVIRPQKEQDIPLAEAIIKAWSSIVPIKYGYDGGCFVGVKTKTLLHGVIHMPAKESCTSLAEWYCAIFHEMVHSTGQFAKRDMSGKFGSQSYAREECTAEFGGVFFSELLGIGAKVFDNAVAYIRSWIKALKDDTKVLYYASKKAEEAVGIIVDKYNQLKKPTDPKLEYCPWKQEKQEEESQEETTEEPKAKPVEEVKKVKEEKPKKTKTTKKPTKAESKDEKITELKASILEQLTALVSMLG